MSNSHHQCLNNHEAVAVMFQWWLPPNDSKLDRSDSCHIGMASNVVKLRCLQPFVMGPIVVRLRKTVFKWQFHMHSIQNILSLLSQLGDTSGTCDNVMGIVIISWSYNNEGLLINVVPILMIKTGSLPHSCGLRGVLIMSWFLPLARLPLIITVSSSSMRIKWRFQLRNPLITDSNQIIR